MSPILVWQAVSYALLTIDRFHHTSDGTLEMGSASVNSINILLAISQTTLCRHYESTSLSTPKTL